MLTGRNTILGGLITAALAVVMVDGLEAQQRTVEGTVVERGSQAPIAGATVGLTGRPPAQTASDGRFRFRNVPEGRYLLTVQGLGWAAEEVSLVVRRDTSLVIELERAPVPLDTLTVESRTISVRGVVSDKATGFELIDVEVASPPDRSTRTDPVGRFRFKGMPSNTPIALQLREMGYLTLGIVVVASADTTIRVELENDPIVERMIDGTKQRLADRAEPRSYRGVPAITRQDLLRNRQSLRMGRAR